MSKTTLEYDGRIFILPYGDLIPPPNSEELEGLTESIREHGVLHTMYHDADDVVISGSTRMVIAKSLGISLAELPLKEIDTADAEMLAIQLNTTGRKWPRERLVVLAHRLRRQQWSIRRIEVALGVSHGTCQRLLEEPCDEVSPDSRVPNGTPENIIGADGKTYPANKPDKGDDKLQFDGDPPAAERTDVPTAEPAEPEKPAANTPKPEKPPLTDAQLLKEFDRHWSTCERISMARGKHKAKAKLWQEIYNHEFDIDL